MTPTAATLAYEIPPHLYSLLKPTRTLIAKAIGREIIVTFIILSELLCSMISFSEATILINHPGHASSARARNDFRAPARTKLARSFEGQRTPENTRLK